MQVIGQAGGQIIPGPGALDKLPYDFIGGVPTITRVHLDLSAGIPGATEAAFTEAANSAKANCPIPRLPNAGIKLAARLV